MQQITSSSNSRFRAAVRLREGRQRRRHGKFLADGLRVIQRLVERGLVPDTLFFSADRMLEIETLSKQLPNCRNFMVEIPAAMMAQLAYGQRNSDLVAVFPTPDHSIDQLVLRSAIPLLVILDRIEKPGNIGAIFRTADAAGADGVLLSDCLADPWNPNAIRASSGTMLSIPWAESSAESIANWLTVRNIPIFTTQVDAAVDFWECDWRGPAAIVIGNEADGVRECWRSGSNQTGIRIPMAGIADSLNASITAALCLFEAARQRRVK